jgi:hypothetical protein
MSQSHVAAGRNVTGQKISGSQASSWPGWARVGFRVGATGAGGCDYCGESDHVQERLQGPGLSQNTFVLSLNQTRMWGDDDLYPCVESFSKAIESEMLEKP